MSALCEVEYDGVLFGRVDRELAPLCVRNGIAAGIRSIRITIDGETVEHLTERRTVVRKLPTDLRQETSGIPFGGPALASR